MGTGSSRFHCCLDGSAVIAIARCGIELIEPCLLAFDSRQSGLQHFLEQCFGEQHICGLYGGFCIPLIVQ